MKAAAHIDGLPDKRVSDLPDMPDYKPAIIDEIRRQREDRFSDFVTGRMRSDRSGSVRRLAGCNYGGSGGRVLIMAAMAAARLN